MTKARKHIYILTVLGIVLFFYRLGASDLWGALVARNAQMAREMIDRGEWIVPCVNGHPDYEKPILWIWVLALFGLPLGINEFSVRLPCAIASLANVYVTYAIGRRVAGARCGFRAALIYMTSVKIMHMARVPRIDVSLTLFTTLAFLFFLRGYQEDGGRRSSYLWASVFAALGVLDKGPVGLIVPAGAIFFYLLLRRDLWHLRELVKVRTVALFLAVAAPWFAAVSVKTAGEFPKEFFLYHNVGMFASYSRSQPCWFYAPQLIAGFLPWSIFLPFALAAAFGRRERARTLYPLVWFLWVFAFFSLSVYKRGDYILPLYPAAALVVAFFWEGLEEGKSRWMRASAKASAGVLIAAVVLAIAAVVLVCAPGLVERLISSGIVRSYSNEYDRDMMGLYAGLLRKGSIFLLALLLSTVLLLWRNVRRMGREPHRADAVLLCIAGFMVFANSYFVHSLLPEVDRETSLKPYSASLMRTIGPLDRFALYDFWYYEFGYYMNREVTELQVPVELKKFFASPGRGYCLVRTKALSEALYLVKDYPHRIEPALADRRGKFSVLVRPEGSRGDEKK